MALRMAFLMSFLLLLAIHGSSGASILDGTKILRQAIDYDIFCSSWITYKASNNFPMKALTPDECQDYFRNYMTSQYYWDFAFVAIISSNLPERMEPMDGKNAWVFDIDDTLLSTLPFYQNHSFGGEELDPEAFNEWVEEGAAPPLDPAVALYNVLKADSWALILITERDENHRQITIENLEAAGVSDWAELVFRQPADAGVPAAIYKAGRRAELVETKGYNIRSCIGDQWSDCVGGNAGDWTFKLPNPMYYIP